jgi:hypothetical protein
MLFIPIMITSPFYRAVAVAVAVVVEVPFWWCGMTPHKVPMMWGMSYVGGQQVNLASHHPLRLRYLCIYISFVPLYLHNSKKLVRI